jgi:Ca-activated chloride channel family protein
MVYRSGAGNEWLAPQVGNHVELKVTGLIARAHVHQVFDNTSDAVVEATYVFPLPEQAAVVGLELLVGDRTIKGQMQEREQAQRTFEQAASAGKKAALLEQERPNLFTTRVANIEPGQSVEVHLHYQHDVQYSDGVFSLGFPATITPRYVGAAAGEGLKRETPPGSSAAASFGPGGWGKAQVRDAERISPPFALSGDAPWLDVEVTLNAGVALRHVDSPSHAVEVRAYSAGLTRVHLSQGPVVADRDFRLRWQPALGQAPHSALFEETFEGDRYALLMLLPPDPAQDSAGTLPKETTFVIDTSGSMSGTSIAQARNSLSIGLSSLGPRDRFNVVAFDSDARSLFSGAQLATPTHVTRALDWVRALEAGGGTEMLSALTLALGGRHAPGPAVRQVVFVTDGSVGNEDQVLSYIQRHLGDQRLFTVGIGSAPNRYFMRGAARFGRGLFTQVASIGEVGDTMNQLWKKLESPVMKQVELAWQGGGQVDAFPPRVPDLYAGEPLVVLARLAPETTELALSGTRAGAPFQTRLSSVGGQASTGIHQLWARRKIETLMDSMIGGVDEAVVRRQVLEVALRHQVASRYTSFVAVDDRPSVDTQAEQVSVPLAVPHGNSMFGSLPQTATPGPFCLLMGLLSVAGSLWVRGGV